MKVCVSPRDGNCVGEVLPNSTWFGTTFPGVACANVVSSLGKWYGAAGSNELSDFIRLVIYHPENVVVRSLSNGGREWYSGLSEVLPSSITSLGGWQVHNRNYLPLGRNLSTLRR